MSKVAFIDMLSPGAKFFYGHTPRLCIKCMLRLLRYAHKSK